MISDHRGNRGDPIDLLSYRDGMAGCPLGSLLIKCASRSFLGLGRVYPNKTNWCELVRQQRAALAYASFTDATGLRNLPLPLEIGWNEPERLA